MLNINGSGVQASELGLATHLAAQLSEQGLKERFPRFEPLVERIRAAHPPPMTPSTTSFQHLVSEPNGPAGPTTPYGASGSSHAFQISNQQSGIFRTPSPGNSVERIPHDAHQVTPNVEHVFGSRGEMDNDRAGNDSKAPGTKQPTATRPNDDTQSTSAANKLNTSETTNPTPSNNASSSEDVSANYGVLTGTGALTSTDALTGTGALTGTDDFSGIGASAPASARGVHTPPSFTNQAESTDAGASGNGDSLADADGASDPDADGVSDPDADGASNHGSSIDIDVPINLAGPTGVDGTSNRGVLTGTGASTNASASVPHHAPTNAGAPTTSTDHPRATNANGTNSKIAVGPPESTNSRQSTNPSPSINVGRFIGGSVQGSGNARSQTGTNNGMLLCTSTFSMLITLWITGNRRPPSNKGPLGLANTLTASFEANHRAKPNPLPGSGPRPIDTIGSRPNPPTHTNANAGPSVPRSSTGASRSTSAIPHHRNASAGVNARPGSGVGSKPHNQHAILPSPHRIILKPPTNRPSSSELAIIKQERQQEYAKDTDNGEYFDFSEAEAYSSGSNEDQTEKKATKKQKSVGKPNRKSKSRVEPEEEEETVMKAKAEKKRRRDDDNGREAEDRESAPRKKRPCKSRSVVPNSSGDDDDEADYWSQDSSEKWPENKFYSSPDYISKPASNPCDKCRRARHQCYIYTQRNKTACRRCSRLRYKCSAVADGKVAMISDDVEPRALAGGKKPLDVSQERVKSKRSTSMKPPPIPIKKQPIQKHEGDFFLFFQSILLTHFFVQERTNIPTEPHLEPLDTVLGVRSSNSSIAALKPSRFNKIVHDSTSTR